MFLDILFAPAARVAGADELGVVFEAGRDRFAAVCIALDKLDHLGFLFAGAPFLEGGDVEKDEGVAIVRVARPIRRPCRGRFRRRRCGRGSARLHIWDERRMLVLLQMWWQRLGHGQLPQPEMLETHAFLSRNSNQKKRKMGANTHKAIFVSRVDYSFFFPRRTLPLVMTASLRNSLHRRNHKERSQLAHRAKYGILEKHKDYVLRARDYHAKQDRLNRLQHKAASRNKDEFYFAMKHEQTVGGVHVKDRGNAPMPMDMVKLLKSQDEGYIRTIKTVGLKVRASIPLVVVDHSRVVENRQDQAATHRSGKPCLARSHTGQLGGR